MKDTLQIGLLIAAIIIAGGLLFVTLALALTGFVWVINNWDNFHYLLQVFIMGCGITAFVGISGIIFGDM